MNEDSRIINDTKSCPFCGGDAFLNYRYTNKHRCFFVFVRCDICGASGKTVTDYEDPAESDWKDGACIRAVNAWNMRVKDVRP